MGKTHSKYPRNEVLVNDETGEKTIISSDSKIASRNAFMKAWGERMALARQLLDEVRANIQSGAYGHHVEQAELFHARTWGH